MAEWSGESCGGNVDVRTDWMYLPRCLTHPPRWLFSHCAGRWYTSDWCGSGVAGVEIYDQDSRPEEVIDELKNQSVMLWKSMMQTVNERLRDESIAHESGYPAIALVWLPEWWKYWMQRCGAYSSPAGSTGQPRSWYFTVTRLESLLASVREVNRAVLTACLPVSPESWTSWQFMRWLSVKSVWFSATWFCCWCSPLVGISSDALYAAAMARPFQDDCSVSGPWILRRIGSDA